MLYVLLGSDIARDKRRPVERLYRLGSILCVCSFILWVILFRFMRERGIESIADLGATLFIALLLSTFAGIGGYLVSMAFHRFIRRVGLWQQTDIGARLIRNGG
jgi:hypothetical protein